MPMGRRVRTARPMNDRIVVEVAEAGQLEPVKVPAVNQGRPVVGVAMIMAAVLIFAGNDVVTKLLVSQYPVPLVIGIRYLVHFGLMLVLLYPRMRSRLWQAKRPWLVTLRGVCLATSSLCMGLAFQRMPVPESVAIVFLAPILVVLAAGPVLGEKVMAASWLAAVAGFAGVLLIVRPGGGLDPMGVVFVLTSVVTLTVYFLLSRILVTTESSVTMLFYTAVVGSIAFGAMLPWSWSGPAPDLATIAMFISQGAATGLGHYLVTAAHREAAASLLAPVNYMQLLWVGILSWLVFGHLPDPIGMAGLVLVTASGAAMGWASTRRPKQ